MIKSILIVIALTIAVVAQAPDKPTAVVTPVVYHLNPEAGSVVDRWKRAARSSRPLSERQGNGRVHYISRDKEAMKAIGYIALVLVLLCGAYALGT